jgi:hypothetical protein
MQLTLKRVLEINSAAKMLLGKPIKSSNLSWRLGRIHRLTEVERLELAKEQNRLIELHGKPVEGKPEEFKVEPDQVKEIEAALTGLLTNQVDIDLPRLDLSSFEGTEVEPRFFDLMDELIVEK